MPHRATKRPVSPPSNPPFSGNKLRPYQIAALRAISNAFLRRGVTRQLLALPTGTGKTVIVANLTNLPQIQRWLRTYPTDQRRILVIAHRDELLAQARSKFRIYWPSARVGVEKAQRHAPRGSDVVVASIQTLATAKARRLMRFPLEAFRIVIVDEAHHAPASSYRSVLALLDFSPAESPKATRGRLLLGVTATTRRYDGIGLNAVFDEVVFERTLPEMIAAGYLCPLRGLRVRTEVSLDSVRTVAGDFLPADLAKVVDLEERNRVIVKAWLQNCAAARATLAFCVNVRHSESLADCFRRHGVAAASLSGKDVATQRHQLLTKFSNGDVRVLTNCNLFTEGFDNPLIDCVLLARPTQSTTLYSQMVGRGTRIAPGKSECVVVDYVDVSSTIPLVTLADLTGTEVVLRASALSKKASSDSTDIDHATVANGIALARPIHKIEISASPVELLLRHIQIHERLAESEFAWLYDARLRVYHITVLGLTVCIHKVGKRWQYLVWRNERNLLRRVGWYSTPSSAQQEAEALLRQEPHSQAGYHTMGDWRDRLPGNGSVSYLERYYGVRLTERETAGMTWGDVSDLIRHYQWRHLLERTESLRGQLNALTTTEELLCDALQGDGRRASNAHTKTTLALVRDLLDTIGLYLPYLEGSKVRNRLRPLVLRVLQKHRYPAKQQEAAMERLLQHWRLLLG